MAVRGRLGFFLRQRQAERGLLDADLLRGGACSDAKNLGAYLSGQSFPDWRLFVQLVDAFRNAGNGLLFNEMRNAEGLWMEEVVAWDRFTSGQTGWVSESRLVAQTRPPRASRTPNTAGGS